MSPAGTAQSSKGAQSLLVLLTAVGVVAFLYGITRSQPATTWGIYLVNLLFWSSLAITGPAIAGMIQLTEGRWSPTVKQMALTTAGFLPVSFVLFLILFFGRRVLYPWVDTPVPIKAAWLNVPFMSLRIGLGVLLLYGVALVFARAVIAEHQAGGDSPAALARRTRLGTILLMLYVVVLSLWGFDLIMPIDPTWYSGLFGGYFAVSALYTGFCLLAILTIRANTRGVASIPPAAVQDVAKLQFAMSIMWMYFFWSQYLVIWYGNVPVETRYVVKRFFDQPWSTLAWVVFVVGWVIPFAYLLKRLTGRPPQRHAPLFVVAVFGLVAIFLERVLVVVPSVSPQAPIPVGLRDVAITVGFLALFALTRRWFMGRYKPVLNLPHTGH